MKVFLLLSLIVANFVKAETTFFQIHPNVTRKYLDRPLHIDDFKLGLTLYRIDRSHPNFYQPKIVIQFFDETPRIIHSIESSLSKEEVECLSDQGQFQCELSLRTLPIPLSQAACSLKALLLNDSGETIGEVGAVRFGKCTKTILGSADLGWKDGFSIQDIQSDSRSPFPKESSKKISATFFNHGDATKRNFEVFAIGENKEGEPLWVSQIDIIGSIASISTKELAFKKLIAPWQYHKLCKLRLVLDPHSRVKEQNAYNNEIEVRFGLCEQNTQANAKTDVAPWIEYADEALTVHIANISKIAIFDSIPFQVEAWDAIGNLTDSFLQSYDKPLHGFGEEGTYHWITGSPEPCRFRVFLDPDELLDEEDRRNNVVEIDHCQ